MFKRLNLLIVVTVMGLALLAGLGATACAPSAPPGTIRVTMDDGVKPRSIAAV